MVPDILWDLVPLLLVGFGPSTDSGTKVSNRGNSWSLTFSGTWSIYSLWDLVLLLIVGPKLAMWRIYYPWHLVGSSSSTIVGPGPTAERGTKNDRMKNCMSLASCWTWFLYVLFDLVPLLLLGPGPCANRWTKVVKMKNIMSLTYCWTWSSRLCGT